MATTNPIRTIVAATDFSTDAAAAVAWAAEVARERSARLVLVHAAMVATPVGPEFIPLPEPYYTDVRDKARGELDRVAAPLENMGIVVAKRIVDKPAALGILDVATTDDANLIVVGTHGLTGWKRVVLGSVAARLVRKAPCPVVTVHAADAERHRPVRTILVPTDFSDDAMRAAVAACEILGILGEGGSERRLILLHAYWHPVLFPHTAKPVVLGSVEEVVAAARREIAALAGQFSGAPFQVETQLVEGFPPEVILEQARRVGADLIAMGTHGRSGLDRLVFGSTAERVLSSAPCPILTVRGTSAE